MHSSLQPLLLQSYGNRGARSHVIGECGEYLRHFQIVLIGPEQHHEQIAVRGGQIATEDEGPLELSRQQFQSLLDLLSRRRLRFLCGVGSEERFESLVNLSGDEGQRFQQAVLPKRASDNSCAIICVARMTDWLKLNKPFWRESSLRSRITASSWV